MKKIAAAVLLLAAVLAVSGCTRRETVPDKPIADILNKYIDRVAEKTAVYKDINLRLNSLQAKPPVERAPVYDWALGELKAARAGIENIEVPEGVEGLHNMYLAYNQGLIDIVAWQKNHQGQPVDEISEEAEEVELLMNETLGVQSQIDAYVTSTEKAYGVKCLNRQAVLGPDKIKDGRYFAKAGRN